MESRLLIAIAALVLLASCAETPSKPTSTGGSSSGSGKVVTATPEEPYECNDDLILPDHQPEECRKPEPPEPVVQMPVELSERRGTATAGLAMYRHSRSRLSF